MVRIRDLRKRTPQQLWRGATRRALTLMYTVLSHAKRTMRSPYGPRLVIRPRDATFRFYVTGTYGTLLSDYLSRRSDRFVFLDIGANMGLFSIVAASNAHCVAVFAFEPVPTTYRYLLQNCELNGAAKVTTFCAAVTSRKSALIQLNYDSRHSGAAHLVETMEAAPGAVLSMTIGPATLNEILQLSRSAPLVVKIDVEGAESDVLRTLAATDFLARVTDIFIEMSERISGAAVVVGLREQLQAMDFSEVARSSAKGDHYDAHFHRRSMAIAS